MTQTIELRLKRVVGEQLDINMKDIVESSKLVEDLGADSLDMVELIMFTEDEFDVEIDDRQMEKVSTFGDLLEITRKACNS